MAFNRLVCIDATTLQANASMKSLVRRDTGQTYDDYLRQLAEAEGLDDCSSSELEALYLERFGAGDAGTQRRQARDRRLREQRLALLYELEATAAEQPRPRAANSSPPAHSSHSSCG